jgi:putative tricarboxylic transport membrane protein
MAEILLGFSHMIDIGNLFAIILGLFAGAVFGAIPGVGPTEGVALLIPITYTMSPIQALLFLCAIYIGGTYGGQIAALLLKVPGSSEAVATIFDGYEMTKKGLVGKALGIGLFSSALGGLFGAIVLMLVAPQLARIALQFGPAEYFALCFLGLSAISGISTTSQIKAVISCLFGLLFATVGLDPINGSARFIFGQRFLQGGIPLVPALIGLFALSEVFNNIASASWKSSEIKTVTGKISTRFPQIAEFMRIKWTFVRAGILGVLIGILPGVGATTAAILGYNQEVRFSKHPEKFGTGIIEGVAAPETANNAAVGGALVPMLSLGIPGSGTTAVLLGALLMHGLRPGPLLISQQKELVYTLFAGMVIAHIILIPVALVLIQVFSKVLYLPYPILSSVITTFCVIGSLALAGRIHAVWVMFVFGLIGYFMTKYSYPTSPMLLGLVMGPLMEPSLRRALIATNGRFVPILFRPLTAVLLIMGLAALFLPYIKQALALIRKKKAEA